MAVKRGLGKGLDMLIPTELQKKKNQATKDNEKKKTQSEAKETI